jgi:hypothetical protein
MLMFLYAGLAFGIRCDEGCDRSALVLAWLILMMSSPGLWS